MSPLWSWVGGRGGLHPGDEDFVDHELYMLHTPKFLTLKDVSQCKILGSKSQILGDPAFRYRYHNTNAIIAMIAIMNASTLIE